MTLPAAVSARRILRIGLFLAAGTLALLLGAVLAVLLDDRSVGKPDYSRIPLAVVGDSDSHSYGDWISFPPGGPERGGEFRLQTLQWTEALSRLRGKELDLGTWGLSGARWPIAAFRRTLGVTYRIPRRVDFEYNFAYSGDVCDTLTHRPRDQIGSLLSHMRKQPEWWRNGVVVIRIGINDFGQQAMLERFAKDPEDQAGVAAIANCTRVIGESVRMIRNEFPDTYVVLVGIFDNTNWPKLVGRWKSEVEISNISLALDVFDDALKGMAEGDERIAFFDDRAWFRRTWQAGPGTNGEYSTVRIGSTVTVQNTSGDSPSNAALADGHNGLVWNVLWSAHLVSLLRDDLGLDLRAVSDAEIAALVKEQVQKPLMPPVP